MLTKKQAIGWNKILDKLNKYDKLEELYIEDKEYLVNLVERDIPKKLIKHDTYLGCPNCDYPAEHEQHHCVCGQRLDRSNEE